MTRTADEARAALIAKAASMTTDQLLEASLRLNAVCTNEAIIVCTYLEREIERRLPEAEFAAHMEACEALLELAA